MKKADGSVDIVNTSAAGTPLTTADKALLTVDVWNTRTTSTTATCAQVRRNLPRQAGELEVCGSQLRLIAPGVAV